MCRTRWYDEKGRTKHEDLTLRKDRRLYHRSPKSTFEKAYMHGWLHERSKKSFGWTKIHVRYFVSCPVEGTLTYWKSEQSWASGDAPWKVISMHDIRVFRSKRTVSSNHASSMSSGGNSSAHGSLGGLRSLRTATKNEDRFGLASSQNRTKRHCSRSPQRVPVIVRIGFTQFVRLFERQINEQRQKKWSVIPRSSIRPIEMSRFKLRTYTTIRIILQKATQHLHF